MTRQSVFLVLLGLFSIALVISISMDNGMLSITGRGTTAITRLNLSEEVSVKVSGSIDFGNGRVNSTAINATLDSDVPSYVGASGNASDPNGSWINTSTWSRFIIIENDGTVNISVNLTADKNSTSFIGGTSPLFQVKGRESEPSSCSNLVTEWTSIPDTIGNPTQICDNLLFSQSSDQFNISAKVVIPDDAISGEKTITLTFSATNNQ